MEREKLLDDMAALLKQNESLLAVCQLMLTALEKLACDKPDISPQFYAANCPLCGVNHKRMDDTVNAALIESSSILQEVYQ